MAATTNKSAMVSWSPTRNAFPSSALSTTLTIASLFFSAAAIISVEDGAFPMTGLIHAMMGGSSSLFANDAHLSCSVPAIQSNIQELLTSELSLLPRLWSQEVSFEDFVWRLLWYQDPDNIWQVWTYDKLTQQCTRTEEIRLVFPKLALSRLGI